MAGVNRLSGNRHGLTRQHALDNRCNRLEFASAQRSISEYPISMSDFPARHKGRILTGESAGGCEPAPSTADRQWWTETVETYVSPLYRFIRARVPAEAVDDLVQETFVSAAGSVSRFDAHLASVWTWLLAIARKRIADYYRASGRAPLLQALAGGLGSDVDSLEEALASGMPLPDQACENEELRLIVRAALGSLEPRDQACLIARYYEDLSLAEVGRVMNLPASAVNSMLHRARLRLRRAVESLVGGQADLEEQVT